MRIDRRRALKSRLPAAAVARARSTRAVALPTELECHIEFGARALPGWPLRLAASATCTGRDALAVAQHLEASSSRWRIVERAVDQVALEWCDPITIEVRFDRIAPPAAEN